MNKLLPIAELIKLLLEDKYGYEAKYKLEHTEPWLPNRPDKDLHGHLELELTKVYEKLVDNKWTLREALETGSNRTYLARIDIWFDSPYNFICEFDEKQHFNQFRLITLEKGYDNIDYSFDIDLYKNKSHDNYIKPGKSGFTKLKSKDILFPKILEGDKQDNRTRQRAFRDFMKDIIPVKMGCNPTLRIPFYVANNKIKNFTEEDIISVKNYLSTKQYLDKIIL